MTGNIDAELPRIKEEQEQDHIRSVTDAKMEAAAAHFDPLPAVTSQVEPDERIATLYLPIEAGCFADIIQAISHTYPNAVVESEGTDIVHILPRQL